MSLFDLALYLAALWLLFIVVLIVLVADECIPWTELRERDVHRTREDVL